MNEDQQKEILDQIPLDIIQHHSFRMHFDRWLTDMEVIGLTIEDIEEGIGRMRDWIYKSQNQQFYPAHYTGAIRKVYCKRTDNIDLTKVLKRM